MLLFLTYYLRSNGEIFAESHNIDDKYVDREAYEKSSDFNDDLYLLKLDILEQYFKDEKNWKQDIIENREEYEDDFYEFFEYNYWVIDKLKL